jgi:hypothetical protein
MQPGPRSFLSEELREPIGDDVRSTSLDGLDTLLVAYYAGACGRQASRG